QFRILTAKAEIPLDEMRCIGWVVLVRALNFTLEIHSCPCGCDRYGRLFAFFLWGARIHRVQSKRPSTADIEDRLVVFHVSQFRMASRLDLKFPRAIAGERRGQRQPTNSEKNQCSRRNQHARLPICLCDLARERRTARSCSRVLKVPPFLSDPESGPRGPRRGISLESRIGQPEQGSKWECCAKTVRDAAPQSRWGWSRRSPPRCRIGGASAVQPRRRRK